MVDRGSLAPATGAKIRSPNREATYCFLRANHRNNNDVILAIAVYLRRGTLIKKIPNTITRERRRIASAL